MNAPSPNILVTDCTDMTVNTADVNSPWFMDVIKRKLVFLIWSLKRWAEIPLTSNLHKTHSTLESETVLSHQQNKFTLISERTVTF